MNNKITKSGNMEAKELRIGNLFTDKVSSKEITVLELLRNGNIVFDFECDVEWQAEPIPLTEEWLLRLGFEENEGCEHNYYKNGGLCFSIVLKGFNEFPFNHIAVSKYRMHNYLFVESVLYVHQLQNLYFSLTGLELEYGS